VCLRRKLESSGRCESRPHPRHRGSRHPRGGGGGGGGRGGGGARGAGGEGRRVRHLKSVGRSRTQSSLRDRGTLTSALSLPLAHTGAHAHTHTPCTSLSLVRRTVHPHLRRARQCADAARQFRHEVWSAGPDGDEPEVSGRGQGNARARAPAHTSADRLRGPGREDLELSSARVCVADGRRRRPRGPPSRSPRSSRL
jgi:hypothetical protein